MGDELALRHDFAAVDTGWPPEVLGLAMEQVVPAVLLVSLAQDAVVWARIGGPNAAVTTVRKTEPRPHRQALSPEKAAEEVRREVRAGWPQRAGG